jgi:YlzJ-like protein
MIHDSLIPLELVFEGMETFAPNYMNVEISGIQMQVEALEAGKARIIRLYSPDPTDYLNPEWSPGSIVFFNKP